jgi:hypothetical protein
MAPAPVLSDKKLTTTPTNLPVPPGTRIRNYGWGRLNDPMCHYGVVTCASRILNGRLWLGLAWCSPKDPFSRKVRRTLAIERLYDHPCIIPFLDPWRAQEDFIAALCAAKVPVCSEIYIVSLLQLSKVPSWSRKTFVIERSSK